MPRLPLRKKLQKSWKTKLLKKLWRPPKNLSLWRSVPVSRARTIPRLLLLLRKKIPVLTRKERRCRNKSLNKTLISGRPMLFVFKLHTDVVVEKFCHSRIEGPAVSFFGRRISGETMSCFLPRSEEQDRI